jgi:hypothetical protein
LKPDRQKETTAGGAAPAAGQPSPLPLAPASSQVDGEDGGGIPAWLIVIVAAAAAAGAVWRGWILYTRRLPPNRPS